MFIMSARAQKKDCIENEKQYVKAICNFFAVFKIVIVNK